MSFRFHFNSIRCFRLQMLFCVFCFAFDFTSTSQDGSGFLREMTSSNGKIFVYSNLDGQGPASKSATHDLFPKQCLRLKDSYFFSIVLLHDSTIAGCQPTCLDLPRLSSAANSLDSRITGCQPTCLDLPSSAANSLDSRIAGCQPTCLDLPCSAANSLGSRIAGCHPTCPDLPRLA